MIDTLLFDLDNTLLDFDKAEANAITRALGDVGISVTNEMRDCYHKINLAQWKLLEQGKMTREEVKMRRFKLLFQEFDIKESQPSLTQEAKPKKKPIIICGDFNVAATELDLKNPKNNVKNAGFTPEEREKFKTLLDSGFTDSYRYLHPDTEKYSWWSYRFKARERNAGWRIDYFLTSDSIKDKIKDAEILTDVMGSDHCPIELDIDI